MRPKSARCIGCRPRVRRGDARTSAARNRHHGRRLSPRDGIAGRPRRIRELVPDLSAGALRTASGDAASFRSISTTTPPRASIRAWWRPCCRTSARSTATPAAPSHVFGRECHEAVEQSRRTIAQAIHAEPARNRLHQRSHREQQPGHSRPGRRTRRRGNHIVSVQTEHKAVLDPLARLARRDFQRHSAARRPARSPAGRAPGCRSGGRQPSPTRRCSCR